MKSLQGAHILVVDDDPDMVTAHANPDLRDRALEEGVDAFLTKPVDPGRLVKVVEDLIGR